MMTFKEIVAADAAAVFLNLKEFAEEFYFNGVKISGMADDIEAVNRAPKISRDSSDFHAREIIFYCLTSALPAEPSIGSIVSLGKALTSVREYIVTNMTAEDGIYALTLEAYES